MQGKNINSLMRHIRNSHNVQIKGSLHKNRLLNIGYYHGYKGYRFIKSTSHLVTFTNFDEHTALYKFDMNLKTLFYPLLMHIETSLKNHSLETIIQLGSVDFDYIFSNFLNDYKSENVGNSKYKKKMKNRLELRESIYSSVSKSYLEGKPVIQHFIHKNEPVPLWAIFEIITLGTFGSFLRTMNLDYRLMIAKQLKITHSAYNRNGRLIESVVFLVKDLRNAVAHNSVIFDCRFKNSDASAELKEFLSSETSIKNIKFESIVDYLILIIYLLSKTGYTKTEMRKVIRDFKSYSENLKEQVPFADYSAILGTDSRKKISHLENYLYYQIIYKYKFI